MLTFAVPLGPVDDVQADVGVVDPALLGVEVQTHEAAVLGHDGVDGVVEVGGDWVQDLPHDELLLRVHQELCHVWGKGISVKGKTMT